MERIYIGMGSNLAEPAEQLRSAIQALAQLPDTQLVGSRRFIKVIPCCPASRATPTR